MCPCFLTASPGSGASDGTRAVSERSTYRRHAICSPRGNDVGCSDQDCPYCATAREFLAPRGIEPRSTDRQRSGARVRESDGTACAVAYRRAAHTGFREAIVAPSRTARSGTRPSTGPILSSMIVPETRNPPSLPSSHSPPVSASVRRPGHATPGCSPNLPARYMLCSCTAPPLPGRVRPAPSARGPASTSQAWARGALGAPPPNGRRRITMLGSTLRGNHARSARVAVSFACDRDNRSDASVAPASRSRLSIHHRHMSRAMHRAMQRDTGWRRSVAGFANVIAAHRCVALRVGREDDAISSRSWT